MSRATFHAIKVLHPEPGAVRECTMEVTHDTRLLFGAGIQPRLSYHHEDRERPLLQHEGAVLAAMPIRRTKGRGSRLFLTCGDDHCLVLWNAKGTALQHFEGHRDAVLRIWQVNDDTLLTLAEDGALYLWDLPSGALRERIETDVEAEDDVSVCQNEALFCVREPSGTRIFDEQGAEQIRLKAKLGELRAFTHLPSGRWITSTNEGQILWSDKGEARHAFAHRLCLKDGWIESKQGDLYVLDDEQTLLWFKPSQSKPLHMAADRECASEVKTFFKHHRLSQPWMDERPTDVHYEHRNNPFSELFIAQDELDLLEEAQGGALENRGLWDFFNRPHWRSMKTALKQTISQGRTLEKVIETSTARCKTDHANAQGRRAMLGWLVFISVVVGMFAYVQRELVVAIPASVLALVSFRYAWRHHTRAGAMRDAVAILAQLPPLIDTMIHTIKAYRTDIVRQARYRHSRSACAATTITEAMDTVITQALEPMALRECGLKREQVIFPNHEAITLRSWSLLQAKSDAVGAKINAHNERSFRWAKGQFVFAVQYIQFIFLTQDKLDVFSLYYDFIADKAYGREAHAFYYKDVTNILKRDVDRTDSGKTFEATEIEMAVSSGQRIALTILNEHSIAALHTLGDQGVHLSREEEIVTLKAELNEIEHDETLDAATKQEEIVWIKRQLRDLQTQPDEQESAWQMTKADEAIENIRTQIRVHKQGIPVL